MEAIMLVVSVISIAVAVFALSRHGMVPGAVVLILGALAFALSRVFDLLGDLLASIAKPEETTKPPTEGARNAT